MSSDHSASPPPTTTSRRSALSRLKEANASSRLSKRKATFLGADDDDDETNPFDFEAASTQRRSTSSSEAARGREGREGTTATRDPILGGAFDDLFNLDDLTKDSTGVDEALQGGLEGDEAPLKKRRIVAKMDETRLLGPTGFPRLQDDIKRLKIKGKGHEAQDLKRVLSMYQLWSHQMYPKTNLRDTLQSVEKLCHKRSVQTALKRYKDEAKHGSSTATDSGIPAEFADVEGDDDLFAQFGDLLPASKTQERPSRTDAKSKVADETNREATGGGMDLEEVNFDEFLDDEDALLAELEAQSRPATSALAKQPSRRSGDESDEDDEAMAAMREAEELLA